MENVRDAGGRCAIIAAVPSQPASLPDDLRGRAFDRAALELARRSQGRVRRKDVVRPYHGVHTAQAPATLLDHCHAYSVRLRPGQMFSHGTAGRLQVLPLPSWLEREAPLDVAAVRPASPPRTRGVTPHRLMRAPVLQPVEGLPVCAPSEAWVQLGEVLAFDEAIIVADHLLTVSPLDEAATRRLLRLRIDATRRAWNPLLRAALQEARCPVLQVGLEYEGAGHADPEQMRFDIARREAFRDAGWEIVRASADDLRTEASRRLLVTRMQRRLAARA